MNGDSKKGFSGLDSLISNVEEGLKDAERQSRHQGLAQARPQGTPEDRQRSPESAPTSHSSQPAPSPPIKTGGGSGKIWLGISGFVILVVWISVQDIGSGRSPTVSERVDPDFSQDVVREAKSVDSRLSTTSRLVESVPPADVNATLTVEQARYCVFWRARILGMESLAVHEPLLEPLEEYYAKYNSECVKRRLDAHYDRAQSELEARRSLIEEEAAQIVKSWKPIYLAPVVRSIQEDLNYLGYDAGPVDGLYGFQTREALLRIQRAEGLQENERITYDLRDALHRATFALRDERAAVASSSDDAAGEGPEIWFGLANRTTTDDVEFVETTQIPNVPGQNFGWYIWVGETEEEIQWRETFIAPEAPLSWEGAENQPDVVISKDRSIISMQRRAVPFEGYLSSIWTVAYGDPPGLHTIVVRFGDNRVETFEFELVNP